MTTERKREIIMMLKTYREEHEISIEKAVMMAEETGHSSSKTTASRIFAKDSEAHADSFRYESLKPYLIAFYGTESATPPREPGNEEQAQQYYSDLEGIKTILAIKNEQLDRLQAENDDIKKRADEQKAEAQVKIEYLKNRVEEVKAVYHAEEARQEKVIAGLRNTVKTVRLSLLAAVIIWFVTLLALINVLVKFL